MQQSEHPLLFGFPVSPHDICVTAFIVASILWALGVVWFDCRYRLIPWRLTLIGSAMVVAGESLLFHEWTDVLCCSAIWSGLYASIALMGACLGSRRPGIGGADVVVGAACGAWLTHGGALLVIVAIGGANIISTGCGFYAAYRHGTPEVAHIPAMMGGVVVATMTGMV
ncbi:MULTISPECIES: prepilin peptidase [Corynebacterium]|uniref:prepilin peptidase n=1 Tax=Corynebacterium TaxID=1716 RepID=UPI00195C3D2D|nr:MULTISPECIES: prepilin peptidase [Corynebacterium]MDN8623503.1 prepilin peptidase [Corynebacterium kroppenstedtii]QRQ64616.1 prepilin peptidase [Corynebacterium kroppenstedtii]